MSSDADVLHPPDDQDPIDTSLVLEAHAQSISAILTDTREDLSRADSKASLVLAALGIGLGAVLGGALAGDWTPPHVTQPHGAVWWTGVGMLVAAVVCAGMAVWPRFSIAQEPHQITYWGDTAGIATLELLAVKLQELKPSLHERQASQLLILSKTVARKYALVRLSIALSGGGGAVVSLMSLCSSRT